jgi:hypothetical protein
MSTRLAKDSARAAVAGEQATATRATNFTTMCFMVVAFLLRFTCSMSGNPQITPSHFLLGEAQEL